MPCLAKGYARYKPAITPLCGYSPRQTTRDSLQHTAVLRCASRRFWAPFLPFICTHLQPSDARINSRVEDCDLDAPAAGCVCTREAGVSSQRVQGSPKGVHTRGGGQQQGALGSPRGASAELRARARALS